MKDPFDDDVSLTDLSLSDLTTVLEDLPVVSALVADDAPPRRHRVRRLLLLALVAGIAAWLSRSRKPPVGRPDLSVVPSPPPAPPATPLRSVPRTFSSPGAVLPGNHAGSAQPLPTGAAPGPDYVIKGNEQSMIFHTPDSPSYARTVAEVWFASEEDAVAAGFRPPKRRTKKSEG